MSKYTPINIHKLNKEAKDFLKECERFRGLFSISRIRVPHKIFDALVESVSPSERGEYSYSIPYDGKNLVRM